MMTFALLLTAIGSFGGVFFWILGVRPYICRNGKGYRTGANMLVAMWVDWQSCGEVARERGSGLGWALYWTYLGLNIAWMMGIGMLLKSDFPSY